MRSLRTDVSGCGDRGVQIDVSIRRIMEYRSVRDKKERIFKYGKEIYERV